MSIPVPQNFGFKPALAPRRMTESYSEVSSDFAEKSIAALLSSLAWDDQAKAASDAIDSEGVTLRSKRKRREVA